MEVCYSGTVTSLPTFFTGRHSHRTHERFAVRADNGSRFEVIDNVSLAPRVPVRPGDHVTVQGELIRNQGGALVHWTHHDPRGRHVGGFIRLGDRVYA